MADKLQEALAAFKAKEYERALELFNEVGPGG